MTKDARVTPALRTRLATAASGALLLLALGAAAPATARTAVDNSPTDLQVEEVTSSSPVMVSDLEAAPAGVTETFYCPIHDGTFGCDPILTSGLVVAELYELAGFGGWRFVIYNPDYSVGCSSSTGDHEGGANLGTYQNKVSSVKTYSQCDINLFDRAGWNGGSTGFIHEEDSLVGSFNNWADSFAIS
ncbi:hypothetical protein AB1046_20280 [Promicromonospora sp. Populi]|uniref:hypothetical protein n=1 Tax=Promicromonospora sp. Populi TaxID=3239420 RepID=UPI0034E291CA